MWKDYWRIESKIFLSRKFSCERRRGAKLQQEVTNPIGKKVKPIRVKVSNVTREPHHSGAGAEDWTIIFK